MVEENNATKAIEPEAARKDWAEVEDADEEESDQIIGQETAQSEEKDAFVAPKKPAGPRPTKNKYGDFVVTKIAVRDPRDKAGKEFNKDSDDSEGEEESEEEESEEEPEKAAEAAPEKSKWTARLMNLYRGACQIDL